MIEDGPAISCRVEPFLDQAAPPSGAGPGVSAAAQPWEARAAHAGPSHSSGRILILLRRHLRLRAAPASAAPTS